MIVIIAFDVEITVLGESGAVRVTVVVNTTLPVVPLLLNANCVPAKTLPLKYLLIIGALDARVVPVLVLVLAPEVMKNILPKVVSGMLTVAE